MLFFCSTIRKFAAKCHVYGRIRLQTALLRKKRIRFKGSFIKNSALFLFFNRVALLSYKGE